MSKLLLLVQNEQDVAHLGAAANAVLGSSVTGVWCVFSPAITVNATEAAAKLDAEIEQLRSAEKSAADRADYEAAAGYKAQREGKELDRQKVLRDAWKTANEDDRRAKVQTLFAPFIAALKPNGTNVRITGHSDHYEREQWVAMLNSLSGVWFKPFTPGSFVVAWPESVETSIRAIGYAPAAPAPPHPAPAAAKALPRAEELSILKHFSLVAVAKKAGVDTTGKSKEEIITEIIISESKASEPALAEY